MDAPSLPNTGGGARAPLSARLEQWLGGLPWPKLFFWFLCIYAPLAWLALLNLPTQPPDATLDLSWMAVLHYSAAHGFQHGFDIAFTYGPLGYLNCTAQYLPGFYLSGIVYQLIFKAFYVGMICRLSARLPRGEALVFVLLSTLLCMAEDDVIHLLTISYTSVLLCGRSNADRAWGFTAVAFVALSTLIKGSFMLYGGFMLACTGVYLVLDRRPRKALWMFGVFGASFLVADLWLGGQSLRFLPAYLRLFPDVIGGYSPAMSTQVTAGGWAGAAMTYGMAWVWLTLLALQSPADPRQRLALFLMTNAGLFLAWKAGLTRGDMGHQTIFFLYAVAIAAAGRVFFPAADAAARETRPSFQSVLALASALAVWTLCLQLTSGSHYNPPSRLAANLRWLLTPGKQHARLERMAQEQGTQLALPRCRAAIGRASVDLFGCEQVLVLANKLNYRPAPIFQSYQSNTPRLIQTNTDLYRSERAPEFVIFKPITIDERFPTLDNAGVLVELLCHYRPMFMEQGCLLLQRRAAKSTPFDPTATPLAAGELHSGEKLLLPKAAGAIWCELDIRPNLLSQLINFVLQAPIYRIDAFSPGGAPLKTYRVVPGMASAGFLLTPLVGSPQDFARAQAGQLGESQRIEAVAIQSNFQSKRLMKPAVRYRLYALPPFAAADGAALEELLRSGAAASPAPSPAAP